MYESESKKVDRDPLVCAIFISHSKRTETGYINENKAFSCPTLDLPGSEGSVQ